VRRLLLAMSAAFALHASAAEPSRWQIDSGASQALFQVTLRVPVKAEGRFQSIKGEVELLPALKHSVRVHLDARELLMGGPSWVQKATVSEQFLDASQYPDIEYRSLPFSEQVLISGGEIKGTLTLKAISRPVLFRISPSTCRRPGFTCAIEVSGTLNRHDFGMSAHRWSLRDEVRFRFALKFVQNE
jgi:polyisoprenoid-binding protein YceI